MSEPFERRAGIARAQVSSADRGRIGRAAIGSGQVDQICLALAKIEGAGRPRLHPEGGRNTGLPGLGGVQRCDRATLGFEISLNIEHLGEHDDIGYFFIRLEQPGAPIYFYDYSDPPPVTRISVNFESFLRDWLNVDLNLLDLIHARR